MRREWALKIVLVVGLISCGLTYPLVLFVEARACIGDDAEPLRHARHFPFAGSPTRIRESEPDRVHGTVELRPRSSYGGQAFANLIARGELIGSTLLVVIGVALIVLAPAKQPVEQASAAAA